MFRKEFLKILSGDTDVNIIVHLYGNTDAVALPDTEATGKHDLILYVVILHVFFKELNDISGALEVAR